jgi:Lrp/AsnC family transcriptional regulator, leucine-responsive regulatory protein
MITLDRIDRAILDVLQDEGRLSNVELSQRVGLSESACLRRVKSLEDNQVLTHYAAHLNAGAVGLSGTVFVEVSLGDQREESLHRFEQAVKDVAEVMECYLMSGDVDYLMRVVVKDAGDFERIHNILTRLPGVARVHSSFALRPVLKRTRLPLAAGLDPREKRGKAG